MLNLQQISVHATFKQIKINVLHVAIVSGKFSTIILSHLIAHDTLRQINAPQVVIVPGSFSITILPDLITC
ncbi:hypothetical protein BDA96_10G331600 [Sorghum bicolor]|jgi:hypothetical protein|uniref:Uncharacterized protein n=2 Tax=Sorghum bicolor TaxID=4558 RepID=A0A921Q6E5_SORBI|nr:hypothetical protein BDA96_10G331600 [Sorghum bicolor]OQU77044.1 hypothetical protein SORBI_3010G256866 [Sorghum bicolor]